MKRIERQNFACAFALLEEGARFACSYLIAKKVSYSRVVAVTIRLVGVGKLRYKVLKDVKRVQHIC